MDIESYIQEAVFGENEQHTCFYQLMWDTFKKAALLSQMKTATKSTQFLKLPHFKIF